MASLLTVFHGHATRENVGDDAIVIAIQAMVNRAQPEKTVEYISFCKDDRRLASESVIGHVSYDSFDHIRMWPKLVSSVSAADVVLIGGGELICGALEFVALIPLAKILGRPTILLGLGADSLSLTGLTSWYTRFGLRYVSEAYVRDRQAATVLEQLGMQANRIHHSADVVFDAALENPPNTERDADATRDRRSIALVLRATQRPDRALTHDRLSVLMNCIGDLLLRENAELHIYPFTPFASKSHVVSDSEDQLLQFGLPGSDAAIAEVARSLLPEGISVVVHPHEELTPAEIVRQFADHDLVISMRLHALILASLAGTRFVGIDYADKIRRVMHEIGAEEQVLQVTSLDDVSGACRDLDRAIANATRFKSASIKEAQERLAGLRTELGILKAAGPIGISRLWRIPVAYAFLMATKFYLLLVKTRHPLVLASGRVLKRGRVR